jgi:pimeloyl-ACP methyl ester carboxylesterase
LRFQFLSTTGVDAVRHLLAFAILTLAVVASPAFARIEPFPAGFKTQEIPTNGTTLHVRIGGHGPAVLMLHGFGDTGDMWAPLAAALAKDHTIVVPDLRGMGLSAHPDSGYTKKNQALDVVGVLDALRIDRVALVTHDIGNMVGYALAVQFPARVTRWVAMDAPLPGIGDWDQILLDPLLWHFNFRGPDEERLVAGRERIYLDRFYNELSAHRERIDEATRNHYAALYARPHAMHDAFEQFGAFAQDAADNRAFLAEHGKLTMPVLAVGAEKSFGTRMADDLHHVARDVETAVVPDSGHWLMEEQPAATVAVIVKFVQAAEPSA